MFVISFHLMLIHNLQVKLKTLLAKRVISERNNSTIYNTKHNRDDFHAI